MSQNAKPEGKVEELPFPSGTLITPDVAPVGEIMEIQPLEIVTISKRRKVLEFGQNLVGWLGIEKDIPGEKRNGTIDQAYRGGGPRRTWNSAVKNRESPNDSPVRWKDKRLRTQVHTLWFQVGWLVSSQEFFKAHEIFKTR
jgi:hypothetical protein